MSYTIDSDSPRPIIHGVQNAIVAYTMHGGECQGEGVGNDMSAFWTYHKNMSRNGYFLDISFFLATEQIQKLRVQKNPLPASFD